MSVYSNLNTILVRGETIIFILQRKLNDLAGKKSSKC